MLLKLLTLLLLASAGVTEVSSDLTGTKPVQLTVTGPENYGLSYRNESLVPTGLPYGRFENAFPSASKFEPVRGRSVVKVKNQKILGKKIDTISYHDEMGNQVISVAFKNGDGLTCSRLVDGDHCYLYKFDSKTKIRTRKKINDKLFDSLLAIYRS